VRGSHLGSGGFYRRKEPTMTFPEDHVNGVERVEDHSVVAVFLVSVAMIGAALASLSFVIP
jgi:hypothetical protein